MAGLMKGALKSKERRLLVIGWMEHVSLPALGLENVKAKIDTGARTSALHAVGIETFFRGDTEWVKFQVPMEGISPALCVEAPVHDRRLIKNTSGVPEERIIIRTQLKLMDQSWPISVSLADRNNMRFPMIVGRTSLKKRNIAVHTRRANLTTEIGQQRP
jgi:hypothetical protein